MRILISTNAYPPNFVGGAELIAHGEAKALIALGHEVEVFAGEVKAFGAHHALRRDVWEGVPVSRISMLPRDYDPQYINFSNPDIEAQFKGLLTRFKPDVFHGHNLTGLSAALPHLAKRSGAVVVITLHDHWGFCFKNTLVRNDGTVCEDFTQCALCKKDIGDGVGRGIPIRFRKDFIRLMLSEVDAFVSPSEYLAATYIKAGFPAEAMNVVWNGVDIERFGKVHRRPDPNVLRITYVGALYPHKGVNVLLDALERLPARHKVRLNVVGDGALRGPLEQLAGQPERCHAVRFWGQIPNEQMETVYEETDVHVLPSVWPENQPVSITEAMACGIPSVASNLGGASELIEDGVSGDLFRAGDPVALAARLQEYLEDPPRADRLGLAAKARIDPHSTINQVQRLLEVFGRALGAPRPVPQRPKLAVIEGGVVGKATAEAAEVLGGQDGWHFVMNDWLPKWAEQEVKLRWTSVSAMGGWSLLACALKGRPTMVEISSKVGRHWDVAFGACCFFSSPDEAVAVTRRQFPNSQKE